MVDGNGGAVTEDDLPAAPRKRRGYFLEVLFKKSGT